MVLFEQTSYVGVNFASEDSFMDVSGTSSKGEMNLEIEFLRTDNEERILASGMLTLSESSSHEWQVNKLEYQSNIYVFLLKYF